MHWDECESPIQCASSCHPPNWMNSWTKARGLEQSALTVRARLPFLVFLSVPASASIFSFRELFSFLHRQPIFYPLHSPIRTKHRFIILRKTTLTSRLSITSPIHWYISMCIVNYTFPCQNFLLKCLLLYLISGGIHICVRFSLRLVPVHLFQQVYSVQER